MVLPGEGAGCQEERCSAGGIVCGVEGPRCRCEAEAANVFVVGLCLRDCQWQSVASRTICDDHCVIIISVSSCDHVWQLGRINDQ